jgi:hypothetical protein
MTTKQLIADKFALFCKVYNLKTTATSKHCNPAQSEYYSNDRVKLDYAPHYGGYRIDIIHTNTSESFFDKSGRLSAKEMICYLDGLIAAKNTNLFTLITN